MQTRFGNYLVKAKVISFHRIRLINDTHFELKPGDSFDVDGIYQGICDYTCIVIHKAGYAPLPIDHPEVLELTILLPDDNGGYQWVPYAYDI